ncbi:putative toxin-antitoxin system toxin component, PIN family [Nodosilinea sp. LEGE 07298]|uniref:putative toxin-antitoxin system toxin component, PIN family n=1 Tax=Nodosilinea sp. LEGE 07298 TaxID=2777970 RepID=UPI00187DDC53|nr:putative toxin-antitoxin system toxin component, PIN family [Nodosilinea sp. LEGE 07298]MBE9111594.1 putative toxin-antitoxin system toxin component, PIN family [Nodosilinea sp. LEGE 07298]
MNVVIDTNIWVSGLLWGGPPGQGLQLARQGQITAYTSPAQLEELARTFNKPKLQPKLRQLGIAADSAIGAVREATQVIAAPILPIDRLRDPDDASILAIAIAATADSLISGDLDLLTLTEISGVPILTPQDFLVRYFPSP